MSSSQPTSLHADPGPIDADDVTCAHSGTVFPSDPPSHSTQPCDQTAVFRVELPNHLGTVAFCPFHLTRWADAYDNRAALYADHFGAAFEGAQPDRVWLTGRDLPPRTFGAGARWDRLGLDQHGHGRFVREHDQGYRLLTFTPEWEVVDLRTVRSDDLRDVLDAVADTVGWVDLDPGIVEQAQDGDRDE